MELYEHSTLSSDFDEEYSEPLNRAVRSLLARLWLLVLVLTMENGCALARSQVDADAEAEAAMKELHAALVKQFSADGPTAGAEALQVQ